MAPFLHDEKLIVQLSDRARVDDIASMPRGAARKTALHRRLVSHAASTQQELVGTIEQLQRRGLVRKFESLWSPNAIIVEPGWGNGTAVRQALEGHGGVDSIWGARDGRILWRSGIDASLHGASGLGNVRAADSDLPKRQLLARPDQPWHLDMVRAGDAHALGARGQGMRFGIIDAGVDRWHPELRHNYAGRGPGGRIAHDWAWMDFSRIPLPFAHDRNGHGTHVASIAVGKELGVAPDATWIAARGSRWRDITGYVKALQWMMAPTRRDGSMPRPELAPDVLGLSWNAASPRDRFFEEQMRNLDAAGIFVSKAAGNEGKLRNGTITSPGQFETVTTVAAVDRHGVVAPFSSHGPSPLAPPAGGPAIPKPQLAAPGVDTPGAMAHLPLFRYARRSGTSNAQPHVAGAALDMLSVAPTLSNAELLQIMQSTARDAGPAGHDVRYGAGLLDVGASVRRAMERGRQLLRLA